MTGSRAGLDVEGLDGVDDAVASLDTLARAISGEDLRALVEEHTRIMHADAVDRARFRIRSRDYSQRIGRKVFTNDDGGFAGTVFVRPYKFQNLPIWLEHGTRFMREPRPHLLPALVAARERFNRAVERLLSRAVGS